MKYLYLREGEQPVLEINGDLWIGGRKDSGVCMVTDQRLAFRFKALLGVAKSNVIEVELADVASVAACNVGGGRARSLVPTGVKVLMKDGTSHVLSVLQRQKLIDAIQAGLRV